jgi:succinylglutamate desuccinylase
VIAAAPRLIGELRGAAPGPTLIVIGGVHGNEPAGIVAARAALGALVRDGMCGEVIALIGNLRASAVGRRCLTEDLNRMWTAERLAEARAASAGDEPPGGDAVIELRELAELAAAIEQGIARARGPVFLLDLHTTSAAGFPFAVVGHTAEHHRFAQAFPLPGIVGLQEALPGVLSGYFGHRGCVTLAIEGGQHTTRAAADNLAAVIAIALEATGIIDEAPGAAAARAYLAGVRGALPHRIEVVIRHAVRPEHGFRMEPGFANLERVAAGTLLARDASGEIRAPFDGVVLLPLYQPEGDDGFFFGRALTS